MSTQNITATMLGLSSQRQATLVFGLYWRYQEAIAKNDGKELAKVLAEASAEHGSLPALFYSAYTHETIVKPSHRQGKGNGMHAGYLAFEVSEVNVDSVGLTDGRRQKEVGFTSNRFESRKGHVTFEAFRDYIDSTLYSNPETGEVKDAPNNIGFWTRVWHAHALRDTGTIRREFATFAKAAKLDKRVKMAELGQQWRVKSPAMMLKEHMAQQTAKKPAKTGTRSKATKTQPEVKQETVTA